MPSESKIVNLILGGGGIKGIAYAGMLEVAEQRGYHWNKIGGVSAGAVAGAFIAAGLSSVEFRKVMSEFDFSKLKIGEISERTNAVADYIDFARQNHKTEEETLRLFLGMSQSSSVFKNILKYSNNGCIFDGDYLEEWIYKTLAKKGIVTFGDVRSSRFDFQNPNGYKIRMTAVDATREKLIVLPDDIKFYGIDPDKMEIARAVRMSTSVPFVFKAVELKKKTKFMSKSYFIVDGGVIDNLPCWLAKGQGGLQTVGFGLDHGPQRLWGIGNPLAILRKIVWMVQGLGKNSGYSCDNCQIGNIDTSKVSFLDFSLGEQEKNYLYEQGKIAAKETLV